MSIEVEDKYEENYYEYMKKMIMNRILILIFYFWVLRRNEKMKKMRIEDEDQNE